MPQLLQIMHLQKLKLYLDPRYPEKQICRVIIARGKKKKEDFMSRERHPEKQIYRVIIAREKKKKKDFMSRECHGKGNILSTKMKQQHLSVSNTSNLFRAIRNASGAGLRFFTSGSSPMTTWCIIANVSPWFWVSTSKLCLRVLPKYIISAFSARKFVTHIAIWPHSMQNQVILALKWCEFISKKGSRWKKKKLSKTYLVRTIRN